MSKRKETDARRPVIIAVLGVALLATALATGGCGKQMARMEANQVKLQAMIMANARQLATVSSQVHTGQNEVNQTLAQIEQKADGINAEVRTVQNNQTQLRATIVNGNDRISGGIAKLETNQAHLKEGIAQVGNIAQNTNAAVGAVARDQATLHRMVQSNKQELADSISAVAQSQQRTHASLDELQVADRSLASQITGVAQQQDGMRKLAVNHNQQLNDRLTTLDSGQTTLQNTLASNTQTLADKLAILEQHQHDVQSVIDRVANTTAGTASDVTALAATQVEMQKAQGTRHENLTGQLAGIARNQQTLQTGIETLDTKADRSTSQLTTLAAGQSGIQEEMQANNASTNERLATLADNQTALQDGIGTLDAKADQTTERLAALATGQSTIQQAMQTNTTSINDGLATIAADQKALQASVETLDTKANQTTEHLTVLTSGQSTLQETMQANNASVNQGLTKIADNQTTLRTEIGRLDEQAEALATNLDTALTNQTAMQNTLTDNGSTLATLSEDQSTLQRHITELDGKADTLTGHVSAVATELDAVHDSVRNGNETSATQMANLAQDQQNLKASVGQLSEQTQQIAAGQATLQQAFADHDEAATSRMTAMANDQQSIRERVDTVMATASQIALNLVTIGNQQGQLKQDIDGGFADVAGGQQALQTNVDALAANTTQIGLDLTAMDASQTQLREALDAGITDLTQGNAQLAADIRTVGERQSALNETLASHDASVAGRMETLAQTQGQISHGIDAVTATATQTALDVIALDDSQTKLEQAAQADRAHLNTRLDGIVANQQQMQTGLDTLSVTTTQVALDVLTLDGKQTQQSEAIQAGHEAVVTKLDTAAQAQQQMQTGLDTLTATTTQVALDVLTLDGQQTQQSQSVQAHHEDLVTRLMATTQGQQQMQGSLDILTATTSQIGLDLLALDGKQDSVAQAVEDSRNEFGPKLANLANTQQKIQTGLDTLTATTTQVALDVLSLDDNQAQQGQALQAGQQTLATQLDTVVQNQQHVQSNLDTVTATTSQVALDVITLDNNQERIEQAVQANREELAARLTEIAQGQQQWLARFDAAEAKVETMTAGITALEQRVTKLQGTLQTSLEDLSTLLDTQSQQRMRFQDSVREDMQSVTDSIAQLREIQAGLAEHIQRVQDSTLTQTGDILSALEQLQQKSDTEATEVEAELKSSKAEPREVMLP